MKYGIFKDYTDLSYWLVNRDYERADEIKIFESDSMHECFSWFNAKSLENEDFIYLNVELENESVWCIYWSDFNENYYICPDKCESTLDDVCFKGSEKECNEFFQKHFICDENTEKFNAEARDEQIAWMDDVDLE